MTAKSHEERARDKRFTETLKAVVYTTNGVPIINTRLSPEQNRHQRRLAKAWESMDLAMLRKLGALPKEEE